ncbi:mediator of RNA polymerase ii transcription subunit 33a [Phtheirospermum japonicum]|uniref:Mediator of RNA polymerase ii transcription subunit 33a n=1 Tax=Phtheirospermum japonicum TaxID=374723 RepID=A0A830CAS7_9LAMI|nr:mediator of RNA polymerase ii transcription subunit 33a [Phtheirospermum japonicum]
MMISDSALVFPNCIAGFGDHMAAEEVVKPPPPPPQQRLWDAVLELTMAAQERGIDPLVWATRLSSSLAAAGVSMPSVEVAELLVSHICWSNNIPIAWKYLEMALALRIVPPLFVLALLSTRVVSSRRRYPVAYRMYMEFIKRYAFSLPSLINGPNYNKIMESIGDVLGFYQIFGVQYSEPGHLVVEFILSTVWELLYASLDDEGLLEHTLEKKSRWPIKSQDMKIDCHDGFEGEKMEGRAALSKMNTLMAIEIIGEFLQNKVTARILYLARRNMRMHWDCFIQHLRLLTAKSASLRNSKNISPEALLQLTSHTRKVLSRACKMSIIGTTHIPSAGICNGTFRSALWLPIDLYLEDIMDGSQIGIAGLVKSLHALNQTTWHDAFLGLWTAALRLVQRERNSIEGPVPRLDTCLCILLSIATLVVSNIVEEEKIVLNGEVEHRSINQRRPTESVGKRREDLVSSLQRLDDFEDLLTPPSLLCSLANQAAAKAMMFLSGISVGSGHFNDMSLDDMPVNCSGNLRHLIVEACIARNILDTSAYLWPRYVKGRCNQIPRNISGQMPEIERIYEIAVTGTDDEKISAAKIFCGASLCCGWNIQVPHLAAALMPICEVFGSCAPITSWTLNTGEAISSHDVFSTAFTLLLKLWRFDQPLLNHVMGDGAPVGSHLTPEYLLLVHNSQIASYENLPKNQNNTDKLSRLSYPSLRCPVFMDCFPKLKCWYRKHQECISCTLSSLVPGNSVHQIVEALLSMMFGNIDRGGQPLTFTSSGSSSSSSASGSDESYQSLKLPAWDILEAVPFVLDAALTACAHGRLSPRELTTGLKNLADFLPAALATIVSYFSAEVTRGLWKPAYMNGTDWPNPAANLSMIEEQIEKVLAATGVNVPNLSTGASSPVTLPLPLAVLLSLTITYKRNGVRDRHLTLVNPAMTNLGISCPWPSMSVIAALWTQKVKHWTDYLIYAASQTVFHHNNDAIVQLLRVCFTTVVGLNSSVTSNGGVGALLGHGLGSQFLGGISAVGPGTLYLRVHRAVKNVMLMAEEMVSILMHTVKDIANSGLPQEKMEKLKKMKHSMKYGQVSLVSAMNRVKTAASLGASLVWLTGGLNSVQYLFKEILPSWFICSHGPDLNNGQELGAMLGGYALAYFIVYSGLFAWGVDSASPASKRRRKVLGTHLEFLASALNGKISLGCNKATWRAYVTGYFSLMISSTPNWMLEVDVEVLKRVSKGLKQWDEDEMGLALLGISGIGAMGAAAEMIIEIRG